MKKFFPLLALVLASFALAQDTATLPSVDPSKLGADVLALASVVLFIVQFFKRQVERPGAESPEGGPPAQTKWPAWAWWGLSILLAEVGAAGLYYAQFGASFGDLPAPWGWLVYGLLSGLVASGFKDLVIGVIKAQPSPSVVIVTPPEGGLEPIKNE